MNYRGRDRFHLLAQGRNREVMDSAPASAARTTRQFAARSTNYRSALIDSQRHESGCPVQASFAWAGFLAWCPVKLPRKIDPDASRRSSAFSTSTAGQSQPIRQRGRCYWTGMHHPAGDHREDGIVARGCARRQLRRSHLKLRFGKDERKIFRPLRGNDVQTSLQLAPVSRASLPATPRPEWTASL